MIGDIAVVRDSNAAALFDESDSFVCSLACTFTRNTAAEVVHNNLGAVLGQFHSVTAADAVSRASDDGDLAVKHAH